MAEKEPEDSLGQKCYGVFHGRANQGRAKSLVLAGMKNSRRLWGIGTFLSGLVPGPGLIEGREIFLA